MDLRYSEVSEEFLTLANQVQNEYFPELQGMGVKIKYLWDTQERKHGGRIVLGSCKKSDDLNRHLSIDEVGNKSGYDYFLFFDFLAWSNAEEDDKIRLLRHELRHIFVPEEDSFKIAPHTVEDFLEEIILNTNKPDWASKLGELVAIIYENQK